MLGLMICVYRKLPSSCQKVLFSATYSDEVREFAQRVVPNPIMITLKRNEETLDNIKQVCDSLAVSVAGFSSRSSLYYLNNIYIYIFTVKSGM